MMKDKIEWKNGEKKFDGERLSLSYADEDGVMGSGGPIGWTLKKSRPILFNTEMVLAVLAGKKIQTRRAVRKQHMVDKLGPGWMIPLCPYGKVGDHLWVRETWFERKIINRVNTQYILSDEKGYGYKADLQGKMSKKEQYLMKFKPSIFMPKVASRILLEVTGVHIERLHDITDSDAKAEGVTLPDYNDKDIVHVRLQSPREIFKTLWQSINIKRYPWEENPWVYVVEFKKIGDGLANEQDG